MRVVINRCFGGFGLSDRAYEQLIEWGVPVRRHLQQERDPETKLYVSQPENDGEVIFDREMTPLGEDSFSDLYWKFKGQSKMAQRYWETWSRDSRSHPLILRVVEELGKDANGACADLAIVEIPDGVAWHIDEYDGREHIAEDHRTWP